MLVGVYAHQDYRILKMSVSFRIDRPSKPIEMTSRKFSVLILCAALGACSRQGASTKSVYIDPALLSLVNLLAFSLLVAALVLLPGGIASLLDRRGKAE